MKGKNNMTTKIQLLKEYIFLSPQVSKIISNSWDDDLVYGGIISDTMFCLCVSDWYLFSALGGTDKESLDIGIPRNMKVIPGVSFHVSLPEGGIPVDAESGELMSEWRKLTNCANKGIVDITVYPINKKEFVSLLLHEDPIALTCGVDRW
jgi:hypothetical protein